MVKPNIREQAANKLQFTKTILEMIKEGKVIKPDMADEAIKDIDEIMAWLDKREYKTDRS